MSTNSAPSANHYKINEEFIDIVKRGDLDEVQRLFGTSKIDPNYKRAKDGKTALHMAYVFGYLDIIRFLIANGANITIKDKNDDNPIDYFIVTNHSLPSDKVINILEYSLTIKQITANNRKNIVAILNKEYPDGKYKRIGMGSYGLVISPEFKTMNESKITKFMFNEDSYNDALNASDRIGTYVPLLSNGLPSEYREEYKFKNIAANNEYVGKILKGLRPNIQNENTVYPLKMENLGISFNNLNDTHIDAIAAIPIKTILEQYKKLADTVREIIINEFIHGDIRETNVVINLSTGKITIIDFDWFLKMNKFIVNYQSQFYAHPPELIFAKDQISEIQKKFSKPITIGEFNEIVNKQLEIIDDNYQYDKIHTIDEIKAGVIETMNTLTIDDIPFIQQKISIPQKNFSTENSINKSISFQKTNFKPKLHTIQENNNQNNNINSNSNHRVINNLLVRYKRQMMSSYSQIDGYGLGYALSVFHNFLEKTIPKRPIKDGKIIDKLKILVNALCHPSIKKRFLIGDFQMRIEKLIASLSLPKENASASASASASAVSYGGKRYKTRRRPLHRKKTYRKRRN
jgi:hypothetical protein